MIKEADYICIMIKETYYIFIHYR